MSNKKVLILVLLIVSLFTLTGCFESEEKSGLAFKKDYEDMNGKTNARGAVHRSIIISEDNVFKEVTAEEIVKMIENNETFYVYFGSTLCPWCRSTIEMADKISRDNSIEIIYYVDIWDEEGNEILRDKYILNDNKEVELSVEGTEAYKKLLTYFDSFLSDYNLSDSDGNSIPVGEKRIFAPNYIYINNGKIEKLITGIPSTLEDSRGELTEDMLKEEEKAFNEFFSNICKNGSGC